MSKQKTVRSIPGHAAPGARAQTDQDPQARFAELVQAYRAGRYDEVAGGAAEFTRAWPEQVVGWNLLAEGCRLTNRLEEAEAACRQALVIDPRAAEAYNNLGNVMRDGGDLEAAETNFLHALALKPTLVEARYNLAGALHAGGRLREAVAAYREAVAQRPDEFMYHCALGVVLKELGEMEAAKSALEHALSLRPDHAETCNDLGNVLRELGDYEAARKSFLRAIELRPGLVEAHNNLGNLERAMGDTQAALACIREALRLDPQHTSAWYNLAMARKFTDGDAELDELREQSERDDLDDMDRVRLNFALGKALADTDADANVVFPHFSEGCRLKRTTFTYDIAEAEERFARIAQCCSREWLASLPRAGDDTDVPIFVVGMPRSGTTLVEQILASHPRVAGAGERKELGRLVAAEGQRIGQRYPEWLSSVSAEQLGRIGGSYRHLVVDPHGTDRVVDKMPSNFRYLGVIAGALPNVRVVHLRRNPVDTCLSCFMHLFNEPQPFSYDLEELGRYYRAYDALMAHWRGALPEEMMLEVEYESLVVEPEAGIRRLLAFCGLDWDPSCLQFHENRRTVVTASAGQVREPVYRHAVGRWHKYRDSLQPLLEVLGPLATTDGHVPAGPPVEAAEDSR